MRGLALVVGSLWLLACGTSSLVVLRFHVERARIVEEECVQRDVPDALRTCYGRCQLIRALNDLRERENQGAPLEIPVKWEPQATVQEKVPPIAPASGVKGAWRPAPRAELRSGCISVPEGVPRS